MDGQKLYVVMCQCHCKFGHCWTFVVFYSFDIEYWVAGKTSSP